MIKRNFAMILTALAATTLLATGCGGDVECGKGTVEKDGKCVAKPAANNGGDGSTCGAGTVLVDGECVLDETGCGAGTELNADGVCVATGAGAECGAGTTLDSVTGQCVANEGIQCGPGTVDVDGKCQPSAENCAAGTVLTDGKCVIAPAACGDGTELDANSGICAATDEICGEGLAFTDGKCVPTEEVCHEGTTFDEDTALCMPESTCKTGDQVIDGICLSPADILFNDPAAQNIDDAPELDLPEVGEGIIFTGTIAPPTDVDGELVNNIDKFTFQGEAGQYIKLSLQALASVDLAFVVEGPEGINDEIYERTSSVGTEVVPARYVYIPYDGEYTVSVMPSFTWFIDIEADGGEGFEFAGTLDLLETPDAKELAINTDDAVQLEGNSRNLPQNLYTVEGVEEDDLIVFSLNDFGAGAASSIFVLSNDTPPVVIEEHTDLGADDTFIVTGHEAFQILVDNNLIMGQKVDYDISAIISGKGYMFTIGAGDTETITGTAPANSFIKFNYDIGRSEGFGMEYAAEDENGDELTHDSYAPTTFFYADGGEFTLHATNDNDATVDGIFTVEIHTAIDLGGVLADEVLLDDVRTYPSYADSHGRFIFNAPPNQILEFRQVHDREYEYQDEFDDDRKILDLWNQDGERVNKGNVLAPTYINTMLIPSEFGGTHGVLVKNLESFDPTHAFQLQIASRPIQVLEADGFDVGSLLTHTTTEKIEQYENEYYSVTINEDVYMFGSLASNNAELNGGDTSLIVYDEDFQVVHVFQTLEEDESFGGAALEAGEYTFRILSNHESPEGFTLELDFSDEAIRYIDITDFSQTYTGTASELNGGLAVDYRFEVPADITYSLNLKHIDIDGGWMKFTLQEDGVTILEKGSIYNGTVSKNNVDFKAGKVYTLHIGGGFSGYDGRYSFELSFGTPVAPAPVIASTGNNTTVATAQEFTDIPVVLTGEDIDILDEENGGLSHYWKFTPTADVDVSITAIVKNPEYGDLTQIAFGLFGEDIDATNVNTMIDTMIDAGFADIDGSYNISETLLAGETYYIFVGGVDDNYDDSFDYEIIIDVN